MANPKMSNELWRSKLNRALAAGHHFRPDLVILVDAARMGVPAGSIRWFDVWRADDAGLGTHGLPLDVVAAYMRTELGCQVALIGIEPGESELDAPLSPAAHSAAREVIAALNDR